MGKARIRILERRVTRLQQKLWDVQDELKKAQVALYMEKKLRGKEK